ncbi:MAG TPA: valine--tRNA ligase [Gammaproteobacteria bacterium]|nr:valine--tRNA ligase [Gammaproteobacteria bacterium]
MEKTYDPKHLEQHWYQTWEQAGYFTPQNSKEPYCIMLPPPNVTGTLHMGHGFQISLMDALIRYQRMCGKQTLWQVGTDHAGIATQMVVERQLLKEGKKRLEIGREAFEQRVWQWKEQSDSTIKGQLRRMGASVDWTRERFSLDPDINQAVVKVFIELFDQGLIYRGKRLVNWDPSLLTAVSDLEVISEEEAGFLWYIRYPLVASKEALIVATTRPETLLGDTAVAVHPEDERYRHFIGQHINHPLTGRTIPIIADTYVDPTFGTGCVKITPAHDFNDYAMGQRHQLPLINILKKDAHINENAPPAYQGLERYVARKRIVADLENLGLLEKVQPHRLQVPRGERSGAVIEPYLTDQWYIKMQSLASAAIDAVKQGQMQFVPENWTKTYFQWLENIQDWCISRQLWWGHRIPVWYDTDGKAYAAENAAQVRKKYHLPSDAILNQDEDVLDTWVSASLWPFATLGWPESTPEFSTFYPTNVLVTGFDILFFWVARMMMMGLKFTGQVPFRTVYITGLIRDSQGQKMSKSKGNVLDPIDLINGIDLAGLITKRTHGLMQADKANKIEQATRKEFPNGIPGFGTDALRFTYCALASTGRNINFDMGRIEGYRNFCNKLWNAARYVLLNTEEHAADLTSGAVEFSVADRWIRSRLQETILQVTEAFADYRFDLLAQQLYEFTWNEYCDWYLEFSKPVLQGEGATPEKRGARLTLLVVLEAVLRLLHPIMPFITEEIWQRVAPLLSIQGKTIMLASYPVFDKEQMDVQAAQQIDWLKQVVLSIRQIRGEMNIAPGKPLPLLLRKGDATDKKQVEAHSALLMAMARLASITWLAEDEAAPPAAAAVVNQLELFIPLAGLIDKTAELQRLHKELDKLHKELGRIQQKLANADYVEKAPAAVVEKERQRAEETQALLDKLQAQKERLQQV